MSPPSGGIHLALSTTIPGVYTAYTWKNISIALWFGPPASLDDVATFERACQRRAEASPHGFSTVHIMVRGGKSMPTPEVRAELSRIFRHYSQFAAGVVVVIPGKGFWASAIRGLVTALTLISQTDVKPQICETYGEVAEWLPGVHAERTGVQVDSRELLGALSAVELAGLQSVSVS
jgi:hypothetical protein